MATGSILSLAVGFDEVSAEGDVGVKVVAEDSVLSLALVEPHPHLVVRGQLQHQTLALHDGPITGLSVQDGHLLLVLHHVQVRLFLPRHVDGWMDEWRESREGKMEGARRERETEWEISYTSSLWFCLVIESIVFSDRGYIRDDSLT